MQPANSRWLVLTAICWVAGAAGQAPSRAQEVYQAERGRELMTAAGCGGCHPIADPRLSGLRKRGPDLRRLASKTTPARALEWILAPRDLSPGTWMPHLFDPEDPDEARAIVAYLWANSEVVEWPQPPAGDAERGRGLYEGVGCTGCHLREAGAERRASDSLERFHGPNLAPLGAKVRAPWLFAWLRDPADYAPRTLMPDLRLSDAEAADLTAFLLEGERTGGSAGGSAADPAADDQAQIEAGREAIELYGCYGCHWIAGFEEAGFHASELTSTAGFAGHGMLGLPNFGFSEDELAAIKAALREGDEPEDLALAGLRRLSRQHNCRGCHTLEGRGPAIEASITEAGMLPPDLRGEGARVQAGWLAGYLEDPGSVRLRAWLTARMPGFGFSGSEIDELVAGFAALAGAAPAPAPTSRATRRELAVGREVFAQLKCARCHPQGEVRPGAGLAPALLGPPLELASRRLRYGWIARLLEEPQRLIPGTGMPDFFERTAAGELESPFAAAIGQEWFAPVRERLLDHFGSEEELESFLLDARRVIVSLTDHVWELPE